MMLDIFSVYYITIICDLYEIAKKKAKIRLSWKLPYIQYHDHNIKAYRILYTNFYLRQLYIMVKQG